MLRSRGIVVTVQEFVRMGLPFTLSAVTAGCLLLWLVWVGPRFSYSPGEAEKRAVEAPRHLTEEEELKNGVDFLKKILAEFEEEVADLFEEEDGKQATEVKRTK